MTGKQKAKTMRAIYAVLEPDFEDMGQSLDDMRFLAAYHKIPLEKMADAAANSLEK